MIGQHVGQREIDAYGSTIMEKPIRGDKEGAELRLKKVASHETPNKLRIYMSGSGDHLFAGEHADRLDSAKVESLFNSIVDKEGFLRLSEETRAAIAILLQRQEEEAARASDGQQPEVQGK